MIEEGWHSGAKIVGGGFGTNKAEDKECINIIFDLNGKEYWWTGWLIDKEVKLKDRTTTVANLTLEAAARAVKSYDDLQEAKKEAFHLDKEWNVNIEKNEYEGKTSYRVKSFAVPGNFFKKGGSKYKAAFLAAKKATGETNEIPNHAPQTTSDLPEESPF